MGYDEVKFRFFEFGEFRLDTHRRTLQKNGAPVHLTPRSFDLLCVMVENAGRVLEHDELLDKVWEGAFVEQGNLKKTISALRQALGESPETSEFITTVPRRGYRFTAPVRPVSDEKILIRETTAEIVVEEEYDDRSVVETAPRTFSGEKKNRFLRPLPILLAVAVLIPSVVLTILYFPRKLQNNFSVEKARVTKIFSSDNLSGGALSGNGSFFSYTFSEKGKNSLRVRYMATGSEVELIPLMNASFWFQVFSPDSNYLYFYFSNREEPSKSGIYRIPALGGVLQPVTEKKLSNLKFSPDGQKIAAVHTLAADSMDRQELITINPDGSDERRIASLALYHLFRGITWSPDGQSILCGINKQPPFEKATRYVAEIALADGAEKIILPEQEVLLFVDEWLPDGKSFLLRQREPNSEAFQIWQYFPDSGEKRRVTNDDFTYDGPRLTADGKTLGVIRSYGLTSIWTAETGIYDFRQISADGGAFFSLAWTGDNRLVYSTTENARDYVGIMNADGTLKRRLTEGNDGIRLLPEVSGNGKSVSFMSDRSGGRQVWNIDLDGRNMRKLTNSIGLGEAKLLADGQTLFFTNYLKSGVWSLMKQTAEGKVVEIIGSDTYDWDLSPDEKFLAVFGPDETTKKNRLDVREIESGRIVKSFVIENLESLHWTRDGQALSFIRVGDDFEEIVRLPLDGTPEQILTTVRSEDIRNFGWSRDGTRIALVRGRLQTEAILIQAEPGN
jgi:DNA-binding winged helix-turn-helix (wHTH) protein/Tol biopolymer transport system component